MRKYWLIGIAGLGLTAAVYFVVNQPASAANGAQAQTQTNEEQVEEEKKEETIYPVELTSPETRTMRTFVLSTATLRADRQVDIFSKVAGQVERLQVEEGERVKQGQVLLALDGDDERLKLKQRKVDLNKAKAEFDRVAKSYEKALIATEEYDKKKFELEKAQAEYDLASYQERQTKVTAPFSGTITMREVEVGQTIQPSQKLFALAALDPLEADVYLPEAKANALKPGMRVEMSRHDGFSDPFEGRISRISPVVDQETGTVKATLAVKDAPANIRPGAYVHLRVITSSSSVSAAIPKKALVYDSRQRPHIFLAAEDKEAPGVYAVRRAAIATDIEEDGFVSVIEGVSVGDLIVLTGKESLKDGAKVRDAAAKDNQLANLD